MTNTISLEYHKNTHNKEKLPIENLYSGLLLTGDNGYGRSELLHNIQIQLIKSGYGMTIINTLKDNSQKLLEDIPENRMDDIIYLTPDSSLGINIFDCYIDKSNPNYDDTIGNLASDFTDILINKSDNIENQVELYEIIKKFIISDDMKSLKDLANLLDNQNNNDFSEIIDYLDSFIKSSRLNFIFSTNKNNLNIYNAIKNNKIIVLDISSNIINDTNELICELFLNHLFTVIKTDVNNNGYFLFINEYQNSFSRTYNIYRIIKQARSHKFGICIALQHIIQQSDKTKLALGKLSNKISFNSGVNHTNMLHISKFYNIKPQKLTELNRYECISYIKKSNEIQNPTCIQI